MPFENIKDKEDKFYRLPGNASPELKALADKMKAGKFKGQYLSSFVSKYGYPAWEKVVFYTQTSKTKAAQKGTSEAKEFFFCSI